MAICGVIIKTIDNSRKPCLCPPGHHGGHNPFSINPGPIVLERVNSLAVVNKVDFSVVNKVDFSNELQPGVIWTNKSKTTRCIWQGPHGRCIYEQGKHQHKEDIPDGSKI